MDNNNKKNSFPGDLDNMRLKDHLNASFELDNLKVSEDLIARTLKAVKDAEVQAEHPEEKTKIKRFPVRRLVSAAAVVLVLLVGIQVMRNSSIGSKKDAGNSENFSTEMAADNGIAQTYGIPETTMDVTGSTESGTTSFGVAEADETNKAASDTSAPAEDAQTQYTAEAPGNISKTAGDGAGLYDGELTFSQIIPVTADSVTALTVTKNNGSQVSLKKVAENASRLYTILDGYSLTLKDGTIKENNSDWTYKVLLTTKDKEYKILIGENIEIQNTKEQAENTTEYFPGDRNALLRELDDFYNSVR